MSNATEKQAATAAAATRQNELYTPPSTVSESQLSQHLPEEPVLQDAPADEVTEPPAWQRLREARVLRQLEQSDIAAELRLDLALVNALEEGNFSKLPEPVYTAGYVRAYARLVDLPPDEMVAKYTNTQAEHGTGGVAAGREKIPARYSQVTTALPKGFTVAVSRGNSKILRYIVILVCIIGFLAIVWGAVNNKSGNNDPINPTSLELELSGPGPSPSPNQRTMQLKTDDLVPTAEVTQQQPKPFTTKSVKLAIPRQDGPAGSSASGAQPGSGASETDLTSVESISLHFSKNSWIDIRDSTGKRLIRRLGLAGASKTVTGTAPFEVLIGYGPGVKMEYNGQPFDFSSFQSKRVARFTLDGLEQDSNSALAAEMSN